MAEPAPVAKPDELARGIESYYRLNFTCHCLDGLFFITGINFVSLSAVLPVFVDHLSHSSILVGLLTTVTVVGNSVPQLFAANAAARYERSRDLLLSRYAWGQRFPWLFLALDAAFVVPRSHALGLLLFFLIYAVYALASGLTIPVWFDTLVKSVPAERRGRVMSVRWAVSGAGSVAAGYVAGRILRAYGFANAYEILFGLAFVLTSLSLVFFSRIYEPRTVAAKTSRTMADFMKELPPLVKGDRNFVAYLVTNGFIGMSAMAAAFYTVYGLHKLHLGPGAAGAFAAVILGAQTLSNLAWGWAADHVGYKPVLQGALCLLIAAALTAVASTGQAAFYVALALFGAATGATNLTNLNIITELCTPDNRQTYVGVASTVNAPVAGLAPLLGGILVAAFGYASVFIVASIAVAAGLFLLTTTVRTVPHGHRAS